MNEILLTIMGLLLAWLLGGPLFALSANRDVSRYVGGSIQAYPVEASGHVYKGGFVGLSASGHAQPLAAGDQCVGIAVEEADNSSGVDGDKTVRVESFGDFEHALSGAARTNIGAAVYASDDGTLTFTATANSLVGKCVEVPSSGTIILRLNPFETVA